MVRRPVAPGGERRGLSADIPARILELVQARGAGSSICPSEVARSLDADWRPLMPAVRDAARELLRTGRIRVTQRGRELAADAEWHGAIRLALPGPHGTAGHQK